MINQKTGKRSLAKRKKTKPVATKKPAAPKTKPVAKPKTQPAQPLPVVDVVEPKPARKKKAKKATKKTTRKQGPR